jgi:hypothetical protein
MLTQKLVLFGFIDFGNNCRRELKAEQIEHITHCKCHTQ